MELYVPADLDCPPAGVLRGAALVGRRVASGLLVAAANPDPRAHPDSYADRCRRAAGALRARRGELVDPASLRLVGYFNEGVGLVNLRDPRTADVWVGHRLFRNDLEASDSRGNQRAAARRDLRRALATGRQDQAARIVARHGWPGL